MHRLSLSASGTPGERTGILPGRDPAVDLVGGLASLVGSHEVERVELAVALLDAGEMLLDDLACLLRAGPDLGRDADRRHGASPRIGGTLNRPLSAAGAAASTSSRSRHGRHDVFAQHVHERHRMGHRLDAVEVERLDVGRVIEDRRELIGVVLELVVGQVEPREARHMRDLLGGDALRHGASCYGTQDPP